MQDPVRVFRKLALANRLANLRLHTTCAHLPPGGYEAARPSFFGSIRATLNHILLVDRFYIGALSGLPLDLPSLEQARECPDLARLARWQAAMDDRLIALVEATGPEALADVVQVDRGDRVQQDRRDDLLSHLFQHQTHHRGQVHGLLSAMAVPPPQLDEFITGDDAPARAPDMAILGWDEARLMR